MVFDGCISIKGLMLTSIFFLFFFVFPNLPFLKDHFDVLCDF